MTGTTYGADWTEDKLREMLKLASERMDAARAKADMGLMLPPDEREEAALELTLAKLFSDRVLKVYNTRRDAEHAEYLKGRGML
jgi:hypothetical protein